MVSKSSILIKNKFVVCSQNSFIVNNGAEEIRAFVLSEKTKQAAEEGNAFPAVRSIENDYSIERRK